jgi:hypothetical protein
MLHMASLYSSKRSNAICHTFPSRSLDRSFLSLNLSTFILCTSRFIYFPLKAGKNVAWSVYYFSNPLVWSVFKPL